ncbi:MAG: anthranilate synthase component I family protein [Bdellovibrionales bacterium]|nr:anthranilate synthase component I family protein [Bdellovibrionales bacterium]
MSTLKILSQSVTIAAPGQSALSVFLKLRRVYRKAFFYQAPGFGDQGAFAVVGLSSEEVIRVRSGQVEIATDGVKTLPGEPISVLTDYIQALGLPIVQGVPFASGGLFGAFGYDFVQHLEPTLKKSGYFKTAEKSVEAELHLCLRLVVLDLTKNTARIVSGNRASDSAMIQRDLEEISAVIQNGIEAKFALNVESASGVAMDSLDSKLKASMGKAKYCENVQTLKEHIRAGDIFQAVLAETFEGVSKTSALEIFKSLYQKSSAPFHFFMDLLGSTLVGASPEALVRVSGERIETNPIAGTRPRGADPEEDLRLEKNLKRSPKEQAEHLMLVDLARNDLGRVSAPGTVKVESYAEIKKFSHVMHLCSQVSGKLQRSRFKALDAFNACFPVGTVSGAPKVRAMTILSQLENVPRGFYGGGFVAMDTHGFLDSSLLIRTLEVAGEKIILRAGAGIVADSDPEREYEEVQNKLRGLKVAILAAEKEQDAP